MCDNCKSPKQKFEAQDDVSLVLDIVCDVKEKFKSNDIINILLGNTSSTVKSYKHDELENYGKGAEDDKNEKYWNAVIRQAFVSCLLSKDVENYGLLKITKEGKSFMNEPYSIMVTKDHDYEDAEAIEDDEFGGGGGKGGSGADPALFGALKDLLKKTSDKFKLPPYVIFQEISLEEMAIQYPITMDEMCNITGVGHGKATRFGVPFIELIAKYVEENEIERPLDMVVKSIVNKSGLKVYIIQNIDRKLPLGLTLTDLITEIERIVSSGTKVNINYYLNDILDEDKQQEALDYFKESESDCIEDALSELGEDEYTEEEIRLMRIKFMSEFGN
jgi:ATP-dependent DNA helicase RecQ